MPELTDAQRRAVEADGREVVVMAGAGSGKTRVLAYRVAHLLMVRGVSAHEIMVVTFTRKAAGELSARLKSVLEEDGLDAEELLQGIRCGTFHSIAYEFLRTEGGRLGYDAESLTVLEADDADILLREVCVDLGFLKGKTWKTGLSWKKVKETREHFYHSGLPHPDRFEDDYQIDSPFDTILGEYWTRLRKLNTLDFGRIMIDCSALLRFEKANVLRVVELNPQLGLKPGALPYLKDVQHVLVDEAQDCDAVQHEFIKCFAPPASVFLVGDYRQSIYGWRGGRPELMWENYPSAGITLLESFRCSDRVIQAANRLSYKMRPLPDAMKGVTDRAGSAEAMVGRSHYLRGLLMDLRKDGFAYSDIAVLARSHRVLSRLGAVLAEGSVPYHHVGAAFKLCDSEAFKMIHAALRLVVNPRDDLALARLREPLGLWEMEYSSLRLFAADAGVSHWQALQDRRGSPSDGLIGAIAGSTSDQAVAQAVEHLASGPLEEIAGSYGVFVFWCNFCAGMTVASALRWFSLRDSQDDVIDGDVVTLTTVHAAKGLEWPVVVVWGLNEGTFPSSQSLRAEDGVQEERRVCYVAFTRAQERLYAHYRRPQDQAQGRAVSPPSRFLGEAGLLDVSSIKPQGETCGQRKA